MPYKTDKVKIEGTLFDGRRKLSEEQKDEILNMYKDGLFSQRQLAEMYNVSRSLIQIIVTPNRAISVKKRFKEHWKEYAVSKEEHANAMKKTRRKKHKLFNSLLK